MDITTCRVPFDAPVIPTGQQPCTACAGHGVADGETYSMPLDDGRHLLVEVFCPECGGCGRADHDACLPGVHALDADEDLDDDGSEPPPGHIGDPGCFSCAGRGWSAVTGWSANDPAAVVRLLRVPCGCTEARAVEVQEADR